MMRLRGGSKDESKLPRVHLVNPWNELKSVSNYE